jgi:arylsulfatase A-like enzyme
MIDKLLEFSIQHPAFRKGGISMKTAALRMALPTLAVLCCCWSAAAEADPRPNVLWITSEDNGPHLGAYGDRFADTPHLDRLAAKGMIYLNAWSNAPVCAPARTTIISGLYPPCTGSEHMRSMTRLPAGMKMYPQYLREAGYYCTNNSKEDYNLQKPGKVWDDSSGKAHWRNRRPGQPFSAVFNLTVTHESQIRRRPHTLVHDPAKVPLPAYHPDTPEVRRDWAQYYDKLTEMDAQAGRILKQLGEDGLADETIVFYYADHGPGMPRSKRWPYNSGLHVPLIVFVPEKFKHLAPKQYVPGGKSDRLVGFIDLAPTLLSIVGIEPPDYMQGHAFMGRYEAPEQPYAYGFRGRMDERYDMVRVVRDKRYIYIRNYMPQKIYGQYIAYMFQTPTTRVWKRLYDQGKLRPPQTFFWETKPPEELYDLQNDPDEVRNLAGSPEHQQVLKRLRKAQQDLALEIRDVGFLPEGEIHSRCEGSTPYEMGHDEEKYPLKKIMATAELASGLKPEAVGTLKRALEDEDSAVRYWAAMGFLMRGTDAVAAAKGPLYKALEDPSPYVRIVAAEALGRYGDRRDTARALSVLLKLAPPDANGVYVSMLALNAVDALGSKARSALETLKNMPTRAKRTPPRTGGYVASLIQKIVADLEPKGN